MYQRAAAKSSIGAEVYRTAVGMQVHVLRFRPHLLDRRMTPQVREAVPRHNAVGLLPDLVATAMAAVSPYATLAITAAVAVFYAAPSTTADVVVSPPPGER